jgi:hypothetical protein
MGRTMSNPMIGVRTLSSQLVKLYPTTPPAGPLKILFKPVNNMSTRSP